MKVLKPRLLIGAAAFLALSCAALAQKNELSFTAGSIFTSDQRATTASCPLGASSCVSFVFVFRTDPGVAVAAAYARQIARLGPASLHLELPVIGIPERDVPASVMVGIGTGKVSGFSASSVFLTPSLKVKFLESATISPFVTVGGGLAHSTVNLNVSGGNVPRGPGSNKGALQFGGGADVKSPIPHLGFRAEVRDFYGGSNIQPLQPLAFHISPVYLHHVFAGGGAVLKF